MVMLIAFIRDPEIGGQVLNFGRFIHCPYFGRQRDQGSNTSSQAHWSSSLLLIGRRRRVVLEVYYDAKQRLIRLVDGTLAVTDCCHLAVVPTPELNEGTIVWYQALDGTRIEAIIIGNQLDSYKFAAERFFDITVGYCDVFDGEVNIITMMCSFFSSPLLIHDTIHEIYYPPPIKWAIGRSAYPQNQISASLKS